jgi:hypothetical protein
VRAGSLEQIARAANSLGYTTKLGRAWTWGNVAAVLDSKSSKRLLAQPAITPDSLAA